MVGIELLCQGVSPLIICYPFYGIRLDHNGLKIPKEYEKWQIEKVIYVPKDDKIYVQFRYDNIVRIEII